MQKNYNQNHEAIKNYLIFHRIIKVCDQPNFTDTKEELFNQIVYLSSKNNLKECRLKSNKKYSAEVVFTFDDGYETDYTIAYPKTIISQIPSIIFLVTDWIGRRNMLNKEQILEMSKSGVDFGSHSVDHKNLCEINVNELKESLYVSKHRIENLIQKKVDCLSFPFGSYNKQVCQIARETGYSNLFCSDHGIGKNRNGLLPRNSINIAFNKKNILKTLHPNCYDKICWAIQDLIKKSIKRSVGRQKYLDIRKTFYEK